MPRQSQYSLQPYQEYRIPVTSTSGPTNYALAYNNNQRIQCLILEAEGDDMVFKFGDGTVAASSTLNGSTKALPAGNFTVTNGHVVQVDLPSGVNLDHVAIQSLTATGGTGIVRLCELPT